MTLNDEIITLIISVLNTRNEQNILYTEIILIEI